MSVVLYPSDYSEENARKRFWNATRVKAYDLHLSRTEIFLLRNQPWASANLFGYNARMALYRLIEKGLVICAGNNFRLSENGVRMRDQLASHDGEYSDAEERSC